MIRRKQEIRKRFDRAAATYDGYADVQQETAAELCSLLVGHSPKTVLELGCGTGGFTQMLVDLLPGASFTGLDFSGAMVAKAKAKNRGAKTKFYCVDCEEYLAETRKQFNCICANATFQWFQEPALVLQHIQRSLAPQGMFVASVFGPDSLAELGAGLQAVMGQEYTLASPQFLGKKQLHTLCHRFCEVEIYERVYERSYATIYDLLKVIKYTGTGGYHPLVPRFNKTNLQNLSDWFMARGGFTVQYQVFFLKARKGE